MLINYSWLLFWGMPSLSGAQAAIATHLCFGKISLQPKSCRKRNCKSITVSRRSGWRHDAIATCGSTTPTATLASTSTSSHSANWLRLRVSVCCIHFALALAFVAFVVFWLFFFGSCHSPLPHATHRHAHTHTRNIHTRLQRSSIPAGLAQDQCCALVNRANRFCPTKWKT